MRRRLFTIFPILSLLVCLAAAVAWVRSYSVGSVLQWSRFDVEGDRGWDGDFEVRSSGGGLFIQYSSVHWMPVRPGNFRFDGPRPAQWRHFTRPALPYPKLRRPLVDVLGFRLAWQWDKFLNNPSINVKISEVAVVVPYWLIVLVTLAFPAWWALRTRRRLTRSRLANVQCVRCGYDLRATPDRCPECGTLRGEGEPAAA